MRIFILVFALLCIVSCKEEKAKEFKNHSNGISYKYLQVGNEENVDSLHVLEVQLMVLSEFNDTLHFVQDYHYFLEPSEHILDSVFRQFHVGDSVLLKIDRAIFNEYFKYMAVRKYLRRPT